jgi:hypothetical protein
VLTGTESTLESTKQIIELAVGPMVGPNHAFIHNLQGCKWIWTRNRYKGGGTGGVACSSSTRHRQRGLLRVSKGCIHLGKQQTKADRNLESQVLELKSKSLGRETIGT